MAARAETFAEGVPCWADAMLSDVEAGKRFYGEIFGWTFTGAGTAPDGRVTALLGGRPAAGLHAKSDGRLPTVWNLHLATRDAFAAVARIREAGGNVLTEPTGAGGADGEEVTAVAADPSGAVFTLLETGGAGGTGTGCFGVQGEHGAYVWSEVYTRDKEAVDAFYAAVFGYGMRDLGDLGASGGRPPGGEPGDRSHDQPARGQDAAREPDEDFAVWAAAGDPVDEEHAIGGRCLIGGTYPAEMPAHFLTYFAVDDCDAAAHKTVRLGGRVLRDPEESPYGRYSVLVDDQGAAFAVLQPPHAAAEGTA